MHTWTAEASHPSYMHFGLALGGIAVKSRGAECWGGSRGFSSVFEIISEPFSAFSKTAGLLE
ncbi:hypothetical protein N8152_01750 [bacterium]|nr:hypothetical protein [bacterium]